MHFQQTTNLRSAFEFIKTATKKIFHIFAFVVLKKGLFILLVSILQGSGICRAQFDFRIPYPKPVNEWQDTVVLSIIGDVMMHEKQLSHDHTTFLEGISDAISKADFSIANMEFPLGGKPYTGYPAFSTPEWYPEYIKKCGIDVFLLANNHLLDRGTKGLEKTLTYYSEMDSISFTGAAADSISFNRNNPLILKRKGLKIALVNFTYGSNIGPEREWPALLRSRQNDIHKAFERAKEQKADFIIALPHWGIEYELRHSERQREWAEWLIDEGADAVIGSHPHVVQDTTHIKGVPVVYSIGNAISNMSAKNTRLELEVRISFTRNFITGKTGMLEPELRFMWCTLPGTLTPSYKTIFVDEWMDRRDEWIAPGDFDNMTSTLQRVKAATGIE